MALFLTKTSLPLRTSPVQRGVWVVEQFLGRKIPAPPPNVGKISEDEKSPDGLPIRDQLAKHRADANCAACHARFDAMGVSLENFDPIGRWRTSYGKAGAIAAAGELPSGQSFTDITGLKQILVGRKELFARMLTERLLTYACGRRVEAFDQPQVKQIVSALKQDGDGLRTLIERVVTSAAFRSK